MTKLNLADLAKKLEEEYKEIILNIKGEEYTVRVYNTPHALVWRYAPDRPEPVRPTIMMRTATGQRQTRAVKKGDQEYDEWLADSRAYENEQDELQVAARYVLSLRDVEYPDLSSPPPQLADIDGYVYPEKDILRKKAWLDCTLLATAANLSKIMLTIEELQSGVNPDLVDSIKKNSE